MMNLPLNTTLIGDALETLRTLPDACVDMCVTSPPYMNLRSYLQPDDPMKALEMGSEPTIAEFIERLVGVFREVRRVLKPTGVLWVNLADSYASGKGSCNNPGGGANSLGQGRKASGAHPLDRGNKSELAAQGIQPKSLMLVPERFLIAMQADGWIVRDRCAWIKGREYADDDVGLNPMPGSQKDRCTNAYEFVYMFVKQGKYYFDWQAIAEPPRGNGKVSTPAGWDTASRSHGTVHKSGRNATDAPEAKGCTSTPLVMPRNVWIFPSRGYKGAHYATFPPELPRRCILVGSSAHGCCSACGKPWVRVSTQELEPGHKAAKTFVIDERDATGAATDDQGSKRARDGHKAGHHYAVTQHGFTPTCECDADVSPAVVLDPFMGSGTTAAVAEELGRAWIGIDLDARNLTLIEQRLAEARALRPKPAAPTLFDP